MIECNIFKVDKIDCNVFQRFSCPIRKMLQSVVSTLKMLHSIVSTLKNVTVYHVRLRKMLQSDLVPPYNQLYIQNTTICIFCDVKS